jgi:hypothetical protein
MNGKQKTPGQEGSEGMEMIWVVLYADTVTTGAMASSARTLSKAAGRSNPTLIENSRL